MTQNWDELIDVLIGSCLLGTDEHVRRDKTALRSAIANLESHVKTLETDIETRVQHAEKRVDDAEACNKKLVDRVTDLESQLKEANEDAERLFEEAKYMRLTLAAMFGTTIDLDEIEAIKLHRARIAGKEGE